MRAFNLQTSKYINSSTKNRSVWVDVLRKVCHTHGIFEPSFDLKKMTLSEIEHAALCPFRFGSLLTTKRPSSIKPLATRLLDNNDETVVDIHLIPGGRFLLTQTDELKVDLWDLGYSPASVIKHLPIASLEPETAVEPDPIISSPIFSLFKTFDLVLGRVPTSLSVSNNICAFQCGRDLTLWDYMADLAVSWKTRFNTINITFSSGCILTYGGRGFDTWVPPELREYPKGGTSPLPTETVSPAPNFNYASCGIDDVFNDGEVIVPHTAWPRGAGRADIINIFLETDKGPMLDSYVVQQLYGVDEPVVVPRFGASIKLSSLDLDDDLPCKDPQEPGRFAGTWFIQPYHTNANDVYVLVTNSANLKENEAVRLSIDAELFTLCPMSGRLCTMDSMGDHIRVLDFIVPN
ncbi:hypothetical protein DXG01_006364 [Tephrocybe rancida]|nr:hypothetical protein DXG01_006364 [Tephrocybe rancida]